jgi:hypothetical protein
VSQTAAKKSAWRNGVAALIVLAPVVAVVVYSSFQVGEYECRVCMSFDGRDLCRTVSAKTKDEALRGATENACALLTSGMTNTLHCTRSEPRAAECNAVASPSPS